MGRAVVRRADDPHSIARCSERRRKAEAVGVLRTNRGEGQDRLLTPSRVWAPPSPDPLHQVRLTQSPTKPARGIPSGHAVSPCSEGTPPARRSGARARKAMPVTSGCNQCLQNWPRSCPATGQRGCFPRDAEPVPPRQRFAHPEQQLHPGAALDPGPPPPRGPVPQRTTTMLWHCFSRDLSLGPVHSSRAITGLWLLVSSPPTPASPTPDHQNNVVTSWCSLLHMERVLVIFSR